MSSEEGDGILGVCRAGKEGMKTGLEMEIGELAWRLREVKGLSGGHTAGVAE